MGVQLLLLLLAIVRGSTFRLRCDACQVAEEEAEAEAEAEAATLEVSFATHCRIVATSSACGIKCKYPCRTMLQLQSPLAECSTCAARQRERERERECCQLARLCDGGAGNEYVLNICRVKHKDDSAATHSSAAPPSSSYCPLNGFGSQSHIRIFAYSVMQLPHTPHAFSLYIESSTRVSIYVLIYHACACLCMCVAECVCVCLALPRLMRGPNMIDENEYVCVCVYFMCAWTEICKRFRFTTRHNTLRQQQAATWQQEAASKKGRRREEVW